MTVVASIAAILSGCAGTDARLHAAATAAGTVAAGVTLPDYPAECRGPMGRVVPKDGEKARWVQKRWEITADQEDKRIASCGAFYDDVKAGFGDAR